MATATRPGPPIVDFSMLSQLPDFYWQGQDRARQNQFTQSLQGGVTDYNDLVQKAAQAGYLPGLKLSAELANDQATRSIRERTLAETIRANKAGEEEARSKPRIFGNATDGFFVLDRSGNPVPYNGPGATAAQPQTIFDTAPKGGARDLPDLSGNAPGQGASLMGVEPSVSERALAEMGPQGYAGPAYAQAGGPTALPPGRPQAVPDWLAGARAPAVSTGPGTAPGAAPGAAPEAPALPPGVQRLTPPRPKAGADVPVLRNDPAMLTQIAAQARAGDTSVFTNLGRGAQGPENIQALRAEMARQDRELARDDREEELRANGVQQAMKNAEYFGTKAGQRTLGTRVANIELASTEFQKLLPIVQAASDKVSRTQYSDINKLILAWKDRTGDPDTVALGGAINTAVNVYARAISPVGAATVNDKEHAREILQRAWANGQIKSALAMMNQEINAALTAPDEVREEWRRRFRAGQGLGAAAEKPAPGGGLQIGHEEGGYRYKGGPPGSSSSWEKVK
jgi:hypothetical protein